jgi:hypothetical protein
VALQVHHSRQQERIDWFVVEIEISNDATHANASPTIGRGF